MPSEISLLQKYLTKEVYEAIKLLGTPYGGTLSIIEQSGLANPDSNIGIYASDPDAYTTFRLLFDPIIRNYHNLGPNSVQPAPNFGVYSDFTNDLNPGRKYILSTRVRCARSLRGFPFNSLLTERQYMEIEHRISTVLANSPPGFEDGVYHTLDSISDDKRQSLIEEHILFQDTRSDRFLAAANATRFWPTGRGIFFNRNKSLVLWINEEDHLRIVSMRKGANLSSIVEQLARALSSLEQQLEFVRDERLGYLTFCPSNIGSTVRASVHMRLPRLEKQKSKLVQMAERNGLQIRGTRGEGSDVEAGVFEFSNKRRCGISEFEAIKGLEVGVLNLIAAEQREEREME